jgi:lysophospholipase L1-like esterase
VTDGGSGCSAGLDDGTASNLVESVIAHCSTCLPNPAVWGISGVAETQGKFRLTWKPAYYTIFVVGFPLDPNDPEPSAAASSDERKVHAVKRLLCLCLACLLVTACLPAGAEKPSFNDTVFVGDSIMQQIGRYRLEQKERGNPVLEGARFLAVSSYSLSQGSRITPNKDKPALMFRGMAVSLPDGLHMMEAKRAFIMLGMNDEAGARLDTHMRLYRRLIERTLKRNPDLELVALSVTPITKRAQTKKLNQANFNAFNTALEALCQELGVAYLDVATPLMNEEGFLRPDFSSDNRVHLSEEGVEVFVETIETFTLTLLEKTPSP